MRKKTFYVLLAVCLCGQLLSSCGEDRTWQYYEKIQTKTWMYDVMQKNYLFYDDMPLSEELDFFNKPEDFLRRTVSDKDGKNGVIFSHVDSVYSASRASAPHPSFGFTGAMVRVDGHNAIRVLYVQKESPATDMGLKRGDWIIAVDSIAIGSNDYAKYVSHPLKAHEFMMGSIGKEGFDTLGVIQTPAPRLVENENILERHIVKSGSRLAYYVMYNEFGKDMEAWDKVFADMANQVFDDVIIDLRYNPGGYVSTAQKICTNLVPAEAVDNNIFLRMLPNSELGLKEIELNFDRKMLTNGHPIQYDNLYVITTGNSASASEALINSLRPYMKGKLLQVGSNTFGKNVSQQKYTDEKLAPLLELWLTTYYVTNSEGFMDYFDHGLEPDYMQPESFVDKLGELGTEQDLMMMPVLYHMANGVFPIVEPEGKPEAASRRIKARNVVEVYNPFSQQNKAFRMDVK